MLYIGNFYGFFKSEEAYTFQLIIEESSSENARLKFKDMLLLTENEIIITLNKVFMECIMEVDLSKFNNLPGLINYWGIGYTNRNSVGLAYYGTSAHKKVEGIRVIEYHGDIEIIPEQITRYYDEERMSEMDRIVGEKYGDGEYPFVVLKTIEEK
jgi:hypothetical protein